MADGEGALIFAFDSGQHFGVPLRSGGFHLRGHVRFFGGNVGSLAGVGNHIIKFALTVEAVLLASDAGVVVPVAVK